MFDDELASINRQINEWENKTEDVFDDVKDSMLSTLRAMKESIERKIQEYEMKKELDRRFEQHIDSRKDRLEQKINHLRGAFSKDTHQLNKKITKSYEAASADKANESFDNIFDKLWRMEQDFRMIASTCRMK